VPTRDLTPNLRILLIEMAPLLADLIRSASEGRGVPAIFLMDTQTAPELAPDVVILGPDAAADAQTAFMRRFPKARVLSLAADLSRLRGPGADEECELTLDSLVERVRG
jgi:hypothetical protein